MLTAKKTLKKVNQWSNCERGCPVLPLSHSGEAHWQVQEFEGSLFSLHSITSAHRSPCNAWSLVMWDFLSAPWYTHACMAGLGLLSTASPPPWWGHSSSKKSDELYPPEVTLPNHFLFWIQDLFFYVSCCNYRIWVTVPWRVSQRQIYG